MGKRVFDKAARLRAVVALLGKQVDVAPQVGISQAALSNYIRGEKVCPEHVLKRLAAEAGVRTAWIETGQGPVMAGEEAAPGPGAAVAPGLLIDMLLRQADEDPRFALRACAALNARFPDQGRPPSAPRAAEAPPAARTAPQAKSFTATADNVQAMKADRRREFIPIVGTVAAGTAFQWNEAAFPPRDAAEYLHHEGALPGMFAMRVEGNSMQEDFPHGSIVVFAGEIRPEEQTSKPALAVYKDADGEKRYALKLVSAHGDTVRMRPTNGAFFDTVEIPRDRLVRLFAVIGSIKP